MPWPKSVGQNHERKPLLEGVEKTQKNKESGDHTPPHNRRVPPVGAEDGTASGACPRAAARAAFEGRRRGRGFEDGGRGLRGAKDGRAAGSQAPYVLRAGSRGRKLADSKLCRGHCA